ncbi:MAG: hypothetical protein GDA49_00850 [Rhodospirillales bacterium]|nr:hypothetical protein [Rhodospirillales bacterium]
MLRELRVQFLPILLVHVLLAMVVVVSGLVIVVGTGAAEAVLTALFTVLLSVVGVFFVCAAVSAHPVLFILSSYRSSRQQWSRPACLSPPVPVRSLRSASHQCHRWTGLRRRSSAGVCRVASSSRRRLSAAAMLSRRRVR